MRKRLVKIYQILIYLLPLSLFFSYYPLISFGMNESMNFELSLPLIWLVLFDVYGFFLVLRFKKIKEVFKNWKWFLFPIYLTITVFWSLNFTRGVLTVGILWFLFFAGFIVWNLRGLFNERSKRIFWRWFFGAAVAVCVWCFLQCILDIVGVLRESSLMCLGCTYRMFGFPHPNGFAIEPQFMGNLLLAPAIISAYFSMKNKKYLWLVLIFSSTIFLTFSRGAIYAFVVAMIFMVAMWSASKCLARTGKLKQTSLNIFCHEWVRATWKVWPIIIVSFLFALNAQGIMAEVSPTNDTYFSGVSKVLNHLSLGIIDVRGGSPEGDLEEGGGEFSEGRDEGFSEKVQASDSDVMEMEKEEAVFDGYVAESTEIRKMLTRNALAVWRRDFRTLMFGVGLGGAGRAMFEAGLIGSPKEIMQNQYASLLLETGILGIMFLIITVWLFLKFVIKNSQQEPILTLMVAYGITLVFFAGLPNALHIYLLLPVLMVFMDQSSLRKKLVS